MKYSVKKGDNVLVLTGKDKGKQGEVLEINKETNRVKVAGVNIQAHHKKPRNKDDKGGILKTEGAIDISNVQVVCPTCKKATRVAHSLVDGKSTRVCKKCGASLDVKKAVKAAKPVKATKAEKVEEVAETSKTTAKSTEKVEKAKPATKTTKAETTTKTATKTTKASTSKTTASKTAKTTTKTAKKADKE